MRRAPSFQLVTRPSRSVVMIAVSMALCTIWRHSGAVISAGLNRDAMSAILRLARPSRAGAPALDDLKLSPTRCAARSSFLDLGSSGRVRGRSACQLGGARGPDQRRSGEVVVRHLAEGEGKVRDDVRREGEDAVGGQRPPLTWLQLWIYADWTYYGG